MTSAGGDLDAAVAELQGVPLESFVAERTRLARELRKAGDRDAAAALAKLAKPTPPAWALNHVAREEPAALRPWLDALDELRSASDGGDGDALRAAMRAHRTATTELVRAVRELAQPGGNPLSDPMADRVRTLLGIAAGAPEVAEALRAGVVVEEPPAAAPARKSAQPAAGEEENDLAAALAASLGDAGSGSNSGSGSRTAGGSGKGTGTEGKAAAGKRGSAAPKPKPKRDRRAEARAKRRAELEERAREAIAALEPLREERERLAAAAGAAGERLEAAQRDLARAKSEAEAADGALADADKAAGAAERDLRRLQKRLDDLAP